MDKKEWIMAIIVFRYNTPEQDAAIRAERERLKKLKRDNPAQYKKETASRRKFTIFICAFLAILAGLVIVLIVAPK